MIHHASNAGTKRGINAVDNCDNHNTYHQQDTDIYQDTFHVEAPFVGFSRFQTILMK